MNITEKPINEINPYKNNPRNNDAAVDKVAASIREFGFKVPIVIDKNNIVVTGHTRLKAAQVLGLDSVPVIVADDLTPEQIKAFRLADNKTAEFATWDMEKLEKEIAEIETDLKIYGIESECGEEPREPVNIDDLLEEYDIEDAVESPIWLTVRTSPGNRDALNEADRILKSAGLHVEKNYE